MMTDPVSDLLTRIRNAGRAGHAVVSCPASKLKLGIVNVLIQQGYLDTVQETVDDAGHPSLDIGLRYKSDGDFIIDGMRRISKPSCRVYVGSKEVAKVRGGIGTAVLSTPRGVITDEAAREGNVGGELMFEVW